MSSHCLFLSGVLTVCFVQAACHHSSASKANDAATPKSPIDDAGTPDLPSLGDLGGKDPTSPDAPASDGSAGASDAASGKDVASGVSDALPDSVAFDVLRAEAASDLRKIEAPGTDALVGPPSCSPAGGSCNDDPIVAAIGGTCQADGTCACNSGFEINPGTGRCRPLRVDAGVATATCSGEFNACGCGCCGASPHDVACYYPTLGESTATLKAKDDASKAGVDCTMAGCSLGIRYVCCVPGAPTPSAASYGTSSYMGDMDHITITKSGSDCATLLMGRPGKTSVSLGIDGPVNWGISGQLGVCGEAGLGTAALGALGTVVLHPSGDACLVDLHVTLFGVASDGVVVPTRFDADGLLIEDFPASACR